MRVHIISDIEGVAGIVKWAQTGGDQTALPRGPQALHRGDQRRRARREGRGRDRDRRDGLPWRGRRLHLQLAAAGRARSRLRVRGPERVDGVHGVPRGRLRRGALRRHARHGRDAGRRALAHRVRPGVAEPQVQRHARRRDRHQRGALRPLGLSRAARHRRPRRVPRGPRAARRRAHDRRGEGRARPLQRAQHPRRARARADRGRARSARSRT